MGSAPLQAAEYDNEVRKTEAMKKAYLEKVGNSIDESNVTLLADASALDAGKQEFITKCKACHGENGEGGVGPNLTDNYWIHGGSISDVYKTIKYGVPAKGMIAWESSLNPIKMQQVASFIMTLNGTNPAGGKAPQGVLYQPAGSATADTTQAAN
jgi:cytochrome c oxidase cbb3-type subunit 3